MTTAKQRPDTYEYNAGSFWLGVLLGLVLIAVVFFGLLALIG
jgi:hypothetical protein